MPTLPTFADLGQVTPQPVKAPDESLDVAMAPYEARAQFGGETAKLGMALNRADYYQGTLQMRYAQSAVSSQQQALMEQLQADPDTASLPQKYKDGMSKIITDNAKNVSNPYHAALFSDWANKDAFAVGQRRMDTYAAARSRQEALGSLDQLTNDQISLALKDPTQTTQALQNISNAYQATVKTGAMDQAHMTMGLQKVTQQLAVARVNFMPPAQALGVLQPMMDRMQGKPQPGADAANANAPASSDDAINFVMNKFEGDHLVANDNGRGPSRYGIVGADNGLTPQQVENLTPDKAASIYKKNYWDAIGADDMPANMRLVAFDTAVNFGVPAAQKMIAQANGDPNALIAERGQAYQSLVQKNPAKYGASAEGWASRQTMLGQTVNNTGIQKVANDWTDFLPPEKVPELYNQATAKNEQEQRLAEKAQKDQYAQTNQQLVSDWATDKLTVDQVLKANLPATGEGSKEWWISKINSGPDKVDPNDPAVIKQRGIMENMKVDNPQGYQNFDFTTLAGKLPGTEIAQFQKDAAGMRNNDTTLAADNKRAKEVTDSVEDMLPYTWQHPKTDTDEQASSGFKGQLVIAARDAAATGGKPLSRDDVRKMASDMLSNVSIKRDYMWDKSVPAYQIPTGTNSLQVYRGTADNVYVPESFRTGFGRAWQNKMGGPPSEQDIRRGYLKSIQPTQQ